MIDPQSVTTAYAYDTLNRLHTLTYNGQTPGFVFGYDDISRRTSLTRPNGVDTTYGYDPVSQLKSVIHSLGATALDGAAYTYDNAGNRLTRTDKRLGTTLTYGYDNIYQLKTAMQGTTTKESYTYDLVGNRLSSLNVSPYNYNSSNELTSTPSGSYTYDDLGNRKTDPTGAQYTWDYENRLTQDVLSGSGGTVNFKYDPFGGWPRLLILAVIKDKVGAGGWPRLLILAVIKDKVGAPSFAFFAKGGRPKCLQRWLDQTARSRNEISVQP